MTTIDNYKELACRIAIQAAKDYERADDAGRAVILKQLRSQYMDFITSGIAPLLADALSKDPQPVIDRIKSMEEEQQ